MDFIQALKITEGVLEQYKADQLKWWKRLDGTPMLNALAVRFAEAMVNAAPQVAQPSAEAAPGIIDHGKTVLMVQGLLDITTTGWVDPDLIEHRLRCLTTPATVDQPQDDVAAERDAVDAKRLDSGMIMIASRNEFGESGRSLHTGVDLRAAIDAALQSSPAKGG